MRVMRGETEVDLDMHRECVTNHCFGEPILSFEDSDLRFDKDGSITSKSLGRSREEPRCPPIHDECEIYKAHTALGLDPALLPCQGAPMPNEIVYFGHGERELFEEVETRTSIAQTLRSRDIFMEVNVQCQTPTATATAKSS